MINTLDGYARFDSRSRDLYRTGWHGGSTVELINLHVNKSQPSMKRLKQIYGRMCRGFTGMT